MARYSFTLTLSDLTVTLSPPSIGFQRSIVEGSYLDLTDFTPNSTPLFNGESQQNWTRRYIWNATVDVTELQALTIEAMFLEQDVGNYIELIDEYEYIEPENPQTKPMVPGSEFNIGATRETGFFQGNVWLKFPNDHKKHGGTKKRCSPTLSDTYKVLDFTLLEAP